MLPEEIITLFLKSASLKLVERTGWSIAGINAARNESVAEHTWGTSFLAWLISSNLAEAGETLDVGKVMVMAVLHDLAESQISDIPQSAVKLGGLNMQEGKLTAEHAAIDEMFDFHRQTHQNAKAILSEYDEQQSMESRIVRGADILDMLLHAISLERHGVNPKLLNPFFESSESKLSSLNIPLLEDIFSVLKAEHKRT